MTSRIYICTHTDFTPSVSNPVYKIADARTLFPSDRAPNGLDALFYSELLTYRHLATHPDTLPDIVGFCSYRKYFSFMDDVPDLEDIIRRHGCIATTPKRVRSTVYEQYKRCLCFADLDIAKAIIRCKYPMFFHAFNEALEGPLLYRANMFIVRKDDFLNMMDIVWDVLDTYIDVVGKDIRQRININKNIYLFKGTGSTSIEHQYRIGGNLGERIVSAMLPYYFPQMQTYDIVFTEIARPHRQLTV